MKRKSILIVLSVILTAAAIGLTACGKKHTHTYSDTWESNENYHWHAATCEHTEETTVKEAHIASDWIIDVEATYEQAGQRHKECTVCKRILQTEALPQLIKDEMIFKTLTVNEDNTVYGKVPNSQTTFSFLNEIKTTGKATFVVSTDIYGINQIPTKTVPINVGDNTFYITETAGSDIILYTVTIRRRPFYTVTFNTSKGTSVGSQKVEEDSFATEPTTARAGYTFTGWDYDFTKAITKNTTITAGWSANTDTKYKVEYYWQNIENDDYTLYETVNLQGTTDTTAVAEQKSYAHFTFNFGVAKGNIAGDGSLVLKLYYTRDKYTIKTNINNAKAGTATQTDGTYKYGTEFTLNATINSGYTFNGWYQGEVLATAKTEYKFIAEKDITLTAQCEANTDTEYKVEYYWENIDDDNYTLFETVNLQGTTDTTAVAEQKSYAHFTFNFGVAKGNIAGDGSLVLKLYYTRDKYTIKTNINNAKAGTATQTDGTYKYGTEFALNATINPGYTFNGWYQGEILTTAKTEYKFIAEKDITLTAQCEVNTDTKYKVEYYRENLENDNYTLFETVNLQGTTDTMAVAEQKTYEYFAFNKSRSVLNGNIVGDGSLILKVYYTRNIYTLSNENTEYGEITNATSIKYGTLVRTEIIEYLGCEFLGWYNGEELLSTDKNYTFNIDKDITVKFKAKDEMSDFLFTATETTCKITGIKDKTVTQIIIPDYVTSIGDNAFKGCSGLTRVEWNAENCTEAGDFNYPIFSGCTNLTTIIIGDNVKTISYSAFYGCTGLTSITIPNSVTSIRGGAFKGCSGLTSITIPDSVTSIGSSAFYNCSGLTSVTIGSSVTWIGSSAFRGCSGLTSVTIGNSVTDIRGNAFYGCSGLTSITIPDSVTSIGKGAFSGCSGLTSITIPDSVTSIGDYAFDGCIGLTSLTIPDSVTSIGDYAFRDCSKLTNIHISSIESWCKITGLDNLMQYGSDNRKLYINGEEITELIIPDSVTNIGNYSFYNCSGLTSITIGNSVTSIGDYAFDDCSGLTNITIPDSVTSIGRYAFFGCDKLTSITIPFIGASREASDKYNQVFGYIFGYTTSSSDRYTTSGSDNSINGTTYQCYRSYYDSYLKEIMYTYYYYIPSGLKTVIIGNEVTEIPYDAFYNCSGLTSVTIGSSVTSIGDYAFKYCTGLTSITIPDSVTSIGWNAFEGCTGLTSVTIGKGVTSIGNHAINSERDFQKTQQKTPNNIENSLQMIA